jgi:hypothetical protein
MLLIDSASPMNPIAFIEPGIQVHRFEDNLGHLAHSGKDGSGRSYCYGLSAAIELGYDYAVMCETDLLFAHPVQQVVHRMHKAGVKVGCLQMPFYQFYEWGFSVYSVPWLREAEFVKRYDWEHAPQAPIPELRVQWLCGDDLFVLPYHGIRNSHHWVKADTLAQFFPYGPPSWVHENAATDTGVMEAFLKLNRIEV